MSFQYHFSQLSKHLISCENDIDTLEYWKALIEDKKIAQTDCNLFSMETFNLRVIVKQEPENCLKIGSEKWAEFLESFRKSISFLGESIKGLEESKPTLTFSKEFLSFLKVNKVVIPEDQIFDIKDFIQLVNSFLLFLLLQNFRKIDAHQNYLSFYKNLIANFLPLIFYTIRNFSIQKNLSISA
ncbi:hypothetical protein SB581_07465 [Acinetobacter baumannii]|nr:hypothetical protein SB581_07465 [Acinetobacter baumannii]